jgi:hypothetical protein
VENYLSSWQYPGQLFWQPVEHEGYYNVFPEKIGGLQLIGLLLPGSGAIQVLFGDHQITNVALRSHVFYQGYVERTWSRDENGTPYVASYGEGTNDGFELSIPIKNVQTNLVVVPGHVIDGANQAIGPYTFEAVDVGLATYTTIVETGQYISSFFP